MAEPTAHGAVILTLSPTGLAAARSLGPRGVRVWGADSVRTESGHFSRWVERDPRIADQPAGPALLQGLMELGAEQEHPPVLYVAGDPYLDFVADHCDALRERFILQDSMRPEVSSVFMNKQTFYHRCLELGVGLPPTFFPDSEEEAREAAAKLRYPAIVKPTHGHLFRKQLRGEKLVEVDRPEDLVAWWSRFRGWGGQSVLQESIPGPEAHIFVAGLYVDRRGVCRSLFTARKSRQYPPRFGSGSYMEACWADEISELSIDLVGRLGYTGICGTEYKWDPRDEQWKLIELNPRPTLWFALPRAAGVDIVWDAHCDLTGTPNPIHIDCQDDTVRWQLPARDVMAAMFFLKRGELGLWQFLRTVVDPRGKEYGVATLSDPGTIVAAPVDLVAKYFSHVRGAG